MHPLSEARLRASFVNASRREASQATLPDLTALDWERLDHLGWRDRKAPLSAYVVVELDGAPAGVLLRSTAGRGAGLRTRGVCTWCRDIVVTDDVTLYVARRAGASGRSGNTLGTLLCTDFRCSQNVRRPPTSSEAGTTALDVREEIVARRVRELRERSARFVEAVLQTR